MSVATSAMPMPWSETLLQRSRRPKTSILLKGRLRDNSVTSPSVGWNEPHPGDWSEGCDGGEWGSSRFSLGVDLVETRHLC